MGENKDRGENTVGIRELKTHLKAYLQRVQAGATITITDRDTPIGRILPVGQSSSEKMSALQEAGIVEWSGTKFSPEKPVATVKGQQSVADLLLEDRR